MVELPELPFMQQANTQILQDDGRVLDNYWRGADMQYRRKLFAYQQKKDEIDNRLKALDISTAGTWQRDLPYVNKKLEDFIGYVDNDPNSIMPTRDNMSAYLTQLQKSKDVEFSVTKSKVDKVTDEYWRRQIVNDPDLQPHAKEYISQLDAWANLPPDSGMFLISFTVFG